jgi:hypothetical protein
MAVTPLSEQMHRLEVGTHITSDVPGLIFCGAIRQIKPDHLTVQASDRVGKRFCCDPVDVSLMVFDREGVPRAIGHCEISLPPSFSQSPLMRNIIFRPWAAVLFFLTTLLAPEEGRIL